MRAVAVHKRRVHYTFNGCMVGVTEMGRGRARRRTLAVELTDAGRVVADRAGARPRRSREHQLPALAQGRRRHGRLRDRRACLRGHRRRHQLGQVPPRRAGPERLVGQRVDRAEITRLGEGLEPPAPWARRRSSGRSTRSPPWPWTRTATEPRRSPRSAPCHAHRREQRRFHRSRAGAHRRHDRGHPRRGGGPPRVPRGGRGPGPQWRPPRVFDTGGGSTQFTFGDGRT